MRSQIFSYLLGSTSPVHTFYFQWAWYIFRAALHNGDAKIATRWHAVRSTETCRSMRLRFGFWLLFSIHNTIGNPCTSFLFCVLLFHEAVMKQSGRLLRKEFHQQICWQCYVRGLSVIVPSYFFQYIKNNSVTSMGSSVFLAKTQIIVFLLDLLAICHYTGLQRALCTKYHTDLLHRLWC
jgi:hypothetical protein